MWNNSILFDFQHCATFPSNHIPGSNCFRTFVFKYFSVRETTECSNGLLSLKLCVMRIRVGLVLAWAWSSTFLLNFTDVIPKLSRVFSSGLFLKSCTNWHMMYVIYVYIRTIQDICVHKADMKYSEGNSTVKSTIAWFVRSRILRSANLIEASGAQEMDNRALIDATVSLRIGHILLPCLFKFRSGNRLILNTRKIYVSAQLLFRIP